MTVEYNDRYYEIEEEYEFFLSVKEKGYQQYYIGRNCISCNSSHLLLLLYLIHYQTNRLHIVSGFPLSNQWDENWIKYIAMISGIKSITKDHRKVIYFVRRYYIRNGFAPMVQIISKKTGLSVKKLFKLFDPHGFGLSVCGMAGLPNANGCI